MIGYGVKALEIVDCFLGEPAGVGQRLLERRSRSAFAARSASVTGDPPDFVTTCAEVRAPGLKYSSASAPASRAAETRRSRAASASISASTLKGNVQVGGSFAACISRTSLAAQSQRAALTPALLYGDRRRASARDRLRRGAAEQFVLVGLVVDAVEIRTSNDLAGVQERDAFALGDFAVTLA